MQKYGLAGVEGGILESYLVSAVHCRRHNSEGVTTLQCYSSLYNTVLYSTGSSVTPSVHGVGAASPAGLQTAVSNEVN